MLDFFSPPWERDADTALKWIEKQPANSQKLVKAAKLTDKSQIQDAAVARITDEGLLTELAKSYCLPAVEAIRNKDILFAIALSPDFSLLPIPLCIRAIPRKPILAL